MSFLSEEAIDKFEEEYFNLRDELMTFKDGEDYDLYDRKIDLANFMENVRRVFLHFVETGEVELAALDIKK